MRGKFQWLSIHGRAEDEAGASGSAASFPGREAQQPQPAGWLRRGALALRSLVAWAARRAAGIIASARSRAPGAESKAVIAYPG